MPVNYLPIKSGTCNIKTDTQKQVLIDKPKCLTHYVIGEWIGTSGCSSSPELCGKWLKVLRGRGGAACEKPSDNIGDEALTGTFVPDLSERIALAQLNTLTPASFMRKRICR